MTTHLSLLLSAATVFLVAFPLNPCVWVSYMTPCNTARNGNNAATANGTGGFG